MANKTEFTRAWRRRSPTRSAAKDRASQKRFVARYARRTARIDIQVGRDDIGAPRAKARLNAWEVI